jgi:hypothetical protein
MWAGSDLVNRASVPLSLTPAVIAHDDGQPITTPYDDCVLVMPSIRQLRPGVTTLRLGQRVAV